MISSRLMTIAVALVLLLSASAGVCDGGYMVVAHPSWPEDTITAMELRAIYLGMRPLGQQGEPVTMYTQTDSALHEEFVREVVGMNPRQFIVYWKRAIFTGTGIPPVNFRSNDEVKKMVSRTPGAIGYVTKGAGDSTVKILEVLQ